MFRSEGYIALEYATLFHLVFESICMDIIQLPESWNIHQIIEDLDEHGFSIIDHAYPQKYVQALVEECTSHLNLFRDAAVQSGVISHIRSDHILWINDELDIAQQHIETLEKIAQLLNQNFYLGIKEVEAHFACYNAGEYYALHRDNPQKKNDRVISTVYYLHENWQDDWGGKLRLQDKNEQWHTIQPNPNRIVLFQSDLLHEVIQAKHQRLSITAWLRNGQVLL